MKYTNEVQSKIKAIKRLINEADYVVVGAGAGLSAAGGLNYMDPEVFKQNYTPFIKKGYKNIWEGLVDNWWIKEENAAKSWGYWANHINFILYQNNQLETYKNLYKLIKDKEYFIITTNGDDQFFKGNFDADKIYAMQGNYKYLQCSEPCSQELYDNQDMIKKMLDSFNEDTLLVSEQAVPRCPNCGKLLIPNLRVDNRFVEGLHQKNNGAYSDFVNNAADKKVVFLELGVGFNTPVIIRWPFEKMTKQIEKAALVRLNASDISTNYDVSSQYIGLQEDISDVLKSLINE